MTTGSLRTEIPVLLPDEAFVRRLAELAAGSTASPGVVVPATFGSPAGRALAAAAAVAAITAGAAAAADQLAHTHDSPAPPISTRLTPHPTPPASDPTNARRDHGSNQQVDKPGSGDSGPIGGLVLTGTPATDSHHGPSAGPSSSQQDNSGPGNQNGPSDDGTDSGGPGHGGPGDDPSDGGDQGGHGGSDGGGSDDAADSASGGSDDGSGRGTGGGDSSGSERGSGSSTGSSSRLLTGSGD